MAHHRHHRHDSKAKKITIYVLMGINILLAILMIVSSFSGTLAPQNYPKLSVMPLLFTYFAVANIIMAIMWLFLRKKFALISAGALLLCITDLRSTFPINIPSNAPQGSIKVMTFNVANRDKSKNSEFVEFFNRINPDILCLQECNIHSNLLEDSVLRLMYPYIEFNDTRFSTTAILSKFPIVSSENIEYESKGNSTTAYNLLIDGDTMLVINSHLQSYLFAKEELEEYKGITGKNASIAEREKVTKNTVSKIIAANKQRGPQVDIVYDYLEKHFKRYTILMGDFNEPPTSYAHYMFTKKLRDAFTRAGNGFGFTYSRNKIHYRIDNILYSEDIVPYETEVDKSFELSDHYPVISYLKLE